MNLNVIIRATEFCNLNCSYCYVSPDSRRNAREVLPLSLLDLFYTVALGSGRFSQVELVWHGGEPLAAGLPYLGKALGAQRKHLARGVRVRNSMQTNGVLITREVADVLREYDVAVGISIDAPSDVHDEGRQTWGRRGSLAATLRGLSALRAAGVSVGALCVLTKRNVNRVREIYEFFSELGVPFKLNPCYSAEDTQPIVDELKVSPEEYGEAICNFLDLYLSDPHPSTQITDLDEVMQSFYSGCSGNCMFAGRCHEFIGVNTKGDVYLCDFFDRVEFRISDIASLKAELLVDSPVMNRIRRRQISRPVKCESCEWWDLCRGGCPSVAFSVWGDAFREDYFCQSRIRLFKEIEYRLKAVEHSRSERSTAQRSTLSDENANRTLGKEADDE